MNRVILIGNLTREPELNQINNDIKVCRLTMAVTRNYTGADGEKTADFFRISCWRGLADVVAQYTHKGSKIAVTGSIELRNYEDAKGVKRTAVEIVAQEVEFLSTKTPNSNEDSRANQGVHLEDTSQQQSFEDGFLPF